MTNIVAFYSAYFIATIGRNYEPELYQEKNRQNGKIYWSLEQIFFFFLRNRFCCKRLRILIIEIFQQFKTLFYLQGQFFYVLLALELRKWLEQWSCYFDKMLISLCGCFTHIKWYYNLQYYYSDKYALEYAQYDCLTNLLTK